jgi:hypothetical protein
VTGAQLQSPVVGVDLSGIMAMLYVVVWLFLVVYVWGLKGESTNVEKEIHLPEMVVNRLFARRRRFFVTFT